MWSVDRRTLLKRGAFAGGALALASAARAWPATTPQSVPKPLTNPNPTPPNILVIVVDQLRSPQGFQTAPGALGSMPNLARLRQGGVSFASHYTAANDCSPARSALVTGLYSHQTGCLITGESTLAPVFPTWGTMLRQYGYKTAWFGKWHLTNGDNNWTRAKNGHALEAYGFDGGTYPSPDGSPGQGFRVDPLIAAQFRAWYASAPAHRPWCTTVSLVNPHDIAWWYRYTRKVPPEASAPRIVTALPANFETPLQLIARNKPTLQLALQETAASAFGPVPFTGSAAVAAWAPFMNLYLKLSAQVDRQIGSVMATLASRPALAANTVVVFTSDHGEYGASHGLRGKGAGAYEEAIKVPLIVKDLRASTVTSAPLVLRSGLTSSVDVAPLLLRIATGSDAWRSEPSFAHIASRHDLAAMLSDPAAPGRPYVLYATDEILSEFATQPYAWGAPSHVTTIRTKSAKYSQYSYWGAHNNTIVGVAQERELYDYSTPNGRLEIANVAGRSGLESALESQLSTAIATELREPIPKHWRPAQAVGFANFFVTAQRDAVLAALQRRDTTAQSG
jgi:arylsulfatase A-like enzyme